MLQIGIRGITNNSDIFQAFYALRFNYNIFILKLNLIMEMFYKYIAKYENKSIFCYWFVQEIKVSEKYWVLLTEIELILDPGNILAVQEIAWRRTVSLKLSFSMYSI